MEILSAPPTPLNESCRRLCNTDSTLEQLDPRFTELDDGKCGKAWHRVAVVILSMVVVGSLAFSAYRWIQLSKMGTLGELSHSWSALVSTGVGIVGISLIFFCTHQPKKRFNLPIMTGVQDVASEKVPTRFLPITSEEIQAAAMNTPTRPSTLPARRRFDMKDLFSEEQFQECGLTKINYEAFLNNKAFISKPFENDKVCIILKTEKNEVLCSQKMDQKLYTKTVTQLSALGYTKDTWSNATVDNINVFDLLSSDFHGFEGTDDQTLPSGYFRMKIIDSEENCFMLVIKTQEGHLLHTGEASGDQITRWIDVLSLKNYFPEEFLTYLGDNFSEINTSKESYDNLLPKKYVARHKVEEKQKQPNTSFYVVRTIDNQLLCTPFVLDYLKASFEKFLKGQGYGRISLGRKVSRTPDESSI